MRKLFLLIPAILLSLAMNAANPTITIDGDKSDWADVPMLTEPGTWPMLKVLPAADANLGTNALAYMMENTEDFDPTWAKYPTIFIDKDYDLATDPSHYWAWEAMGVDYKFTTAINDNGWKDFPKGITENNKAIEVGIPATYLTDLESKFGFAMYYNSGAWYCPLYSGPAISSPANGLLYKTRSYTKLPGTVTAANAYAHQSIGECTDYVDFGLRDNGNDTARWAAFPVELVNPGKYDITAYVSTTLGWKFEFWLVDVATNAVVAHMDAPESNVSSSKSFYNFGTMDLSSVPAGKYMLKVKNRTQYSTVKLHSVMIGGGIADIPCTLNPANAELSTRAWVDKSGAVDSILFTPRGYEGYNDQEYVKFKVKVTKAGFYNFTAHVCRPNGSQKYEIKLFNSDETDEKIGNIDESIGSGDKTISTGKVELTTGVYVLRVRNTYNYAESRLIKVVASYEGGSIIAIPDTLRAIDAIKSERAFVNEAGELRFTDDGHDGHVREQYGKWNISVAKAGNYKFTVRANSANAHAYELTLRNSTETQDIASTTQKGSSGQQFNFALDVENLAIGNYVLNIRDTTKYSHGRIEYIAASYEGGAVVNAPGVIPAAEAVLLKEDGGTLKMSHLENGDIKYDENEQNLTEYAQWNLHATEAGEMLITVNAPSGGHTLRFELYQGTTLKSSAEEEVATKWDHNYNLTQHLNIPEAGDYTLKLINKQQYSVCVLHTITLTPYVAPAAIILDEAAENNSAWVANVGGDAVNVQLKRTFKGGVYNSICVPFEAPMSKIKAAFGNDVELLYLNNVSMSGDILNLEFAAAPDFYQGTPYLIKPSADVVDPTFNSVELLAEQADATSHSGWEASFRGTFVKQTIPANENNLYLGTDNKLYFSSNDVTIKGLRAYFHVSIPGAAQAVKHARIVTREQVVTDIDLVNSEKQDVIKTIENGQVIIIRDGIRYNVIGTKIQ